MLVMHFMCTPDRFEIKVVRIPEEFEPLMDKDVMYEKIRKTI
jgi:hypothetical protein